MIPQDLIDYLLQQVVPTAMQDRPANQQAWLAIADEVRECLSKTAITLNCRPPTVLLLLRPKSVRYIGKSASMWVRQFPIVKRSRGAKVLPFRCPNPGLESSTG